MVKELMISSNLPDAENTIKTESLCTFKIAAMPRPCSACHSQQRWLDKPRKQISSKCSSLFRNLQLQNRQASIGKNILYDRFGFVLSGATTSRSRIIGTHSPSSVSEISLSTLWNIIIQISW